MSWKKESVRFEKIRRVSITGEWGKNGNKGKKKVKLNIVLGMRIGVGIRYK